MEIKGLQDFGIRLLRVDRAKDRLQNKQTKVDHTIV
jgi:hypothetical protein